jgi:hypothetical protein
MGPNVNKCLPIVCFLSPLFFLIQIYVKDNTFKGKTNEVLKVLEDEKLFTKAL